MKQYIQKRHGWNATDPWSLGRSKEATETSIQFIPALPTRRPILLLKLALRGQELDFDTLRVQCCFQVFIALIVKNRPIPRIRPSGLTPDDHVEEVGIFGIVIFDDP